MYTVIKILESQYIVILYIAQKFTYKHIALYPYAEIVLANCLIVCIYAIM